MYFLIIIQSYICKHNMVVRQWESVKEQVSVQLKKKSKHRLKVSNKKSQTPVCNLASGNYIEKEVKAKESQKRMTHTTINKGQKNSNTAILLLHCIVRVQCQHPLQLHTLAIISSCLSFPPIWLLYNHENLFSTK